MQLFLPRQSTANQGLPYHNSGSWSSNWKRSTTSLVCYSHGCPSRHPTCHPAHSSATHLHHPEVLKEKPANSITIYHGALPATSSPSGQFSLPMLAFTLLNTKWLPAPPPTLYPNPIWQQPCVQLPSGMRPLTLSTPPCPPMLRMAGHTPQAILWHYTQTLRLPPPPTACVYQVMQQFPVSHPTNCPPYFMTKHCTHYDAHLKHIRFKTHDPCSCIKLLSWPNDMFPP